MTGGIFGNMFDLNRDGKLDSMERATEFMVYNKVTKKNYDEGYDDFEEDIEDELEMAGLDYEELLFMDEDERIEALEDAGLNLDDYEF